MPRRRCLVLTLALTLSGPFHVSAADIGLLSAAGQFRLQAQTQSLLLTDRADQPLKRWPLRDRDGQPVQVQALAQHAARAQFIVALAGSRELWLISHDPAAPPLYNGWVHDWRMAEGVAEPGYLGLQRVRLLQPVTALWTDARVPWILAEVLMGAARQAAVLHLDIRREIAWLPLDGPLAMAQLLPDAAGGWQLALPDHSGWSLFDTKSWQRRRVERLPGP